MRISGINSNTFFTSCSRTYKKDTKAYPEQTRQDIGLLSGGNNTDSFKLSNLAGTKMNYICKNICTLTHLLREDINWNELMEILATDFAKADTVNVYSLAGSDGSEGVTFAMLIKERLDQNQQTKYGKIKVSDIDREVINTAKSGIINLSSTDFELMKKYNISPSKYFEPLGKTFNIENNEESRFADYSGFKLSKELRCKIDYRQGDIIDVMKTIDKSQISIVMCRNVMPYLSENYVNQIVKNAQEKLKPGSLFIIGDFDHITGIENKLYYANFEKIAHNIFRKAA